MPRSRKRERDGASMLMQTRVRVDGLSAKPITDFFLNPTDDAYRRWWPGTHLAFHVCVPLPGYVGSVIWMDEYVGSRRLRMKGIVEEAVPGRRIVWRMRKIMDLPLFITLELEENPDGVTVIHTLSVAARGAAVLLGPFVRVFLSARFRAAMDAHARAEFPLLKNIIRS
jgi:hypothetical protein